MGSVYAVVVSLPSEESFLKPQRVRRGDEGGFGGHCVGFVGSVVCGDIRILDERCSVLQWSEQGDSSYYMLESDSLNQ